MSKLLQPYRFVPQYKHVIWGGTRIGTFKGVDLGSHTHVGESWELSGIAGHESVVLGGADAGLTLPQLIVRHGARLIGERLLAVHGTEFPLLFKFIDATRDLSVQVHPDDEMARRLHGCAGKAEMWYVINADSGARIGAGMVREYGTAEFESMVNERRVMDTMKMHDSCCGDVYDLSPGCLHMIGAGNLLAEVQQACDITYRVWDHDRIDADGKPRELHTALALQAVDPTMTDCRREPQPLEEGRTLLVSRREFIVERLDINGIMTMSKGVDDCRVLMVVDGDVTLNTADKSMILSRGTTVLVPAECPTMSFTGNATVLNVAPNIY